MHPRPTAHPAAAPQPRVYVNQTFAGVPGREGLEVVGAADVTFTGCRFVGGSTCLRLNGCGKVTISRCTFECPTGPADPDGQCIDILRPEGVHTIDRCTFLASPATEDLINVYGDQPSAGSVIITGCSWIGRGTSGSSTSVCMDEANCVPVTVRGGRIQGARCGITLAGGGPHVVDGVRFVDCGVKVYVYAGYGKAPKVLLDGYTAADVLIGDGVGPGDVTVQRG
jgi:hypothetical protein